MTGIHIWAWLAAPVLALAAAPALAGELDRAVLGEINFARTHPAQYARALEAAPDGDRYGAPDPGALEEAVSFLERQAPLRPLAASAGLASSAAEQAAAQGPRGWTGHVGADGSSPGERMRRHGVRRSISAEAISYGYGVAAGVVRQLVIDADVPGRGHRMVLFDPNLQIAGVGCGPHAVYRYVCVIDFAGTPAAR